MDFGWKERDGGGKKAAVVGWVFVVKVDVFSVALVLHLMYCWWKNSTKSISTRYRTCTHPSTSYTHVRHFHPDDRLVLQAETAHLHLPLRSETKRAFRDGAAGE